VTLSQWHDESCAIADAYQGGRERYRQY
jgi:hypothetical protein